MIQAVETKFSNDINVTEIHFLGQGGDRLQEYSKPLREVALGWLLCGVRLVIPFVQGARDYRQRADRELSQVDTFGRLAGLQQALLP